MRLSIDHRTLYRFTEPQARLVQMLRLTPQNTHDQTVASWDIAVDRDVRMKPARDGYGNAATLLYVDGPLEALEIRVSGEVLTSHSNGVVIGAPEGLPPELFLRPTAMTPEDPAILAFAADLAPERSLLGRLHDLNAAVHARFAVSRDRPEAGLDSGVAFVRDRVTPRDLSHIFLVAARGLGAPARYVSGYHATEGAHEPTPHGWAEAHVPEIGWIGFDPCTGRSPEEEYVRVAVALDSLGAAPVAGSRLGEGREQLDVDVVVRED